MRNLLVLATFLLVSGCVSSSIKSLCTSSGYMEDTPQYDSCVARNNSFSEEIRYCQSHYSIYHEGVELNQCMQEARNMKSRYKSDYYACRGEAIAKYPSDMTRAIPPTTKYKYNEAGQLIESYVITQEKLPESEINNMRDSVGKSCMRTKGWSSYSSYGWNGQKQIK